MAYRIESFKRFTGSMPGNSTYEVRDLRQLWVFCRGDRDQLARLASYTPFEPRSDVFVLGVADFSSGPGWFDASLVLPVTFRGEVGGSYFFEYEDQHDSVAMGREAWGYPKALARVEWQEDAHGISTRVYDYDTDVFSIEVDFDSTVDDSAWRHLAIYPQYQVRAVPQQAGSSFDSLDVLSRDPSRDWVAKDRLLGRAEVKIGRLDLTNGILDGERLEVVEVLGAELCIGDYYSTAENGVPRKIASLL
ncbi:acetoacetate decarboxylase family protein [Leucobacter sp. wl10]|uniref:acetoacetate decarboxylase family protein n=1 Tax=Leucobacter sp. wl10 TaxID=2304677 RepID=UPI0013C3009C|nr:acetoacetate decarboxylase family protein [Leucobacter sp. wl10]